MTAGANANVDVTALLQAIDTKMDGVKKEVSSLSDQFGRLDQKMVRYHNMEDMVAEHEARIREIRIENAGQQKEIDSLCNWRTDVGKYLLGTIGTSLILAVMSFILSGGLRRLVEQ